MIFFRDQQLDVAAHKRLARAFGDIFVHPNFNTGDHDPEVVTITRNPGDTKIVGEEWHTDTTMMAEPPMDAPCSTPSKSAPFGRRYLVRQSISCL